jgi:hypothetical protein
MANSNIPASIIQKAPITKGPATPAPVQSSIKPSAASSAVLSKLQFRLLFTTAERVAVDNASTSTNLTLQQKSMLNTIQQDLNAASSVTLNDATTIAGINYLVTCGIITSARAAQILANVTPA